MNLKPQFASTDTALYQVAFVVPDMARAVEAWTRYFQVGPFFEINHWSGENATYYGEPALAKATHLFSSTGDLSLELVHPEDDLPSVFRETIRTRGYGLQHLGYVSGAFEDDTRALLEQGYQLAFRTNSPIGPYRFFAAPTDGDAAHPKFIELCEGTMSMRQTFGRVALAASQWDGRDPLRSFAKLENPSDVPLGSIGA